MGAALVAARSCHCGCSRKARRDAAIRGAFIELPSLIAGDLVLKMMLRSRSKCARPLAQIPSYRG